MTSPLLPVPSSLAGRRRTSVFFCCLAGRRYPSSGTRNRTIRASSQVTAQIPLGRGSGECQRNYIISLRFARRNGDPRRAAPPFPPAPPATPPPPSVSPCPAALRINPRRKIDLPSSDRLTSNSFRRPAAGTSFLALALSAILRYPRYLAAERVFIARVTRKREPSCFPLIALFFSRGRTFRGNSLNSISRRDGWLVQDLLGAASGNLDGGLKESEENVSETRCRSACHFLVRPLVRRRVWDLSLVRSFTFEMHRANRHERIPTEFEGSEYYINDIAIIMMRLRE